ncbi:MAG: hypothetical protein JJE25_09765, partial [Bacteroidia bacterium]|nr:hypothetical protein [Bacteroidia bacterium]
MRKITSIAKIFLMTVFAVLSSAVVYETMGACSVSITTHPASATICADSSVSLTTVYNLGGCAILSVVWQYN